MRMHDLVVLFAFVTTSLTCCPELGHSQTVGGTLRVANVGAPGTFDPHVAGTSVEGAVITQLFEGLVGMDEHFRAKPMLAEDIQVSPDAKVYTFKLRRGVRFHNGQELTSADVLASFERFRRVSPVAKNLSDVERFEAPDPYTFIVRLSRPNAIFLDIIKTPSYGILPASERDKPPREAALIGTGPFQMGEWQRDSHVVLRRFKDYVPDTRATGPDGYVGNKAVYVDAVRINVMPEANSRVAALKAGDIDINLSVQPELAKQLAGWPGVATAEVFPGCQNVYILNSQNPPTDNVLVRKAIQAVVNVHDVVDASGLVAKYNPSLLYPDSPYYTDRENLDLYDLKSTEKSRTLLKEAGYHGEKVVLQTNANYAYMRDAVLVLAEELKKAGVNVDVQVVDWITNYNNMEKGQKNWNVSSVGFCSQPLLGPQQWRPMIYNLPSIKGDKALDSAYAKFMESLDVADRKAAWSQAERRILDQAYFIKIADSGLIYAFSKKLKGIHPWNTINFWNIRLK